MHSQRMSCSYLTGDEELLSRLTKTLARPQVQAAIRDGRGGPRSATANGNAVPPPSPTARGSKGALPALPEGAEAALLYVRFRAAAEPGLKGAFRLLTASADPQQPTPRCGEIMFAMHELDCQIGVHT